MVLLKFVGSGIRKALPLSRIRQVSYLLLSVVVMGAGIYYQSWRFSQFSSLQDRVGCNCCRSNLKVIGIALQHYAADHDGQFPDGDGTGGLQQLLDDGYLDDASCLRCPVHRPSTSAHGNGGLSCGNVSYIYHGGLRFDPGAADSIVCYDQLGNHREATDEDLTGSVNVLFADGTVKKLSLDEWRDAFTTFLRRRTCR